MKIDNVKINGFGKIKNKEIDFTDGINLVYGENESGKSTILKFMEAMLYGISKNKNGKNISDYDKFKPWEDLEFSGKMKYTLESGDKYEVFREFKKKNPTIYNGFGEDISKEFKQDKTKGIHFFEEQVGIDETSFCSTAMIEQQEVKLGKTDTNNIVQKISNLVSTGDDTISFKKSMEKLNKMQTEKVGNDRTKQKPMNIVDSKIKELLEEKKKLISYQENAKNNNESKDIIKEEIEELQIKKEKLKNAKQTFKDNEIKNIETKFKMRIYIFLLMFLVVMAVVLFVALKNKMIGVIPTVLSVIDIFMLIKIKQKTNPEDNLDSNKIEKEMENIEIKINDLKLKEHILENEKANLDEKLEKLTRIEEQLEEQKAIKQELISLDTSFYIAKECLNKAYEEIKHNISPKFQQKLCEIACDLTDGKYKNLTVNDETGLNIEMPNGTYMPVDRLSIGTIDEMYLSLRLSTLSEISSEKLPIILDETFAYFDNQRLKNILRYLQDKNYDSQIIIFTCSNREEKALSELKIEYNLINLEK